VARDVEFNMTASDKTGPAMASVAGNAEKTQEKIRRSSDRTSAAAGDGWVKSFIKTGPKIIGAVKDFSELAAKNSGPILAGAGVAAAPLIAGTLSAAIIGGAGIGGVLGGVALVKDDPRVAAAGTALGKNLTSDLKDFAKPFIDPVIRGAATIEDRFDEVGGNLRSIFANSARYVAPLVDGSTRFLQGVIRGADALVAKAAPVIRALSEGLAQAGTDVNEFFTEISRGSDGAAVSVRQLVDLFGGALAVLGPLINGINQVSAALDRVGISPGILQLIGRINDANSTTGTFTARVQGATTAIAAEGATASAASLDINALNASVRGSVNAHTSLYGATTNAAQAIRDAKKAIDDNGASLSLNTQKGLENRTTLQNLATALNSNYDAYVQVNGAGQAADAVLRGNRAAFIQVATAASGSAAKAKQLANELLGIPRSTKPKVELLDNATGKINNVINRLGAVKSKTVTLNIAVRQSGDASALRKQSLPSGLKGAAGSSFAAGTDGNYRTGGPAEVNVQSNVSVSLDGKPFYDYTDRVVQQERKRAAWRARVGTV
jgi:hypothetical protein